ncbi:hypothetical protein AMTR_s00104p00141150, partial [Amborella trichopoda]
VMVREPDEVRELLTDASFFTRERPFSVGGPFDNIFIDACGLVRNKAITETKEALHLESIRGCILPFRGVGDKKLEGYFSHCFVGHMTVGYRLWWDSSNAECRGAAHLWLAVIGSKHDSRAVRHFVPPPFFVIFSLDHYPADWQELVRPCLLSGDENRMKLLSLRRKTKSFFDNLEVIVGQ